MSLGDFVAHSSNASFYKLACCGRCGAGVEELQWTCPTGSAEAPGSVRS